jgi:abortive infection bacteriophage resistance protein
MPRQVKPFLSIEQQINHLRSAGMRIDDEESAAEVLSDTNYYRLINAYALDLYANDKKTLFKPGVSFGDVYGLYAFDCKLRHILSEMLEEFEIVFRTRLAYHVGETYGPLGYLNSAMFSSNEYFMEMLAAMQREKSVQCKSPIVKHHDDNYSGDIPIWAIVEILPFGTISKMFKNMLPADKAVVSRSIGVHQYAYLESWLRTFVEVRNTCAHYGRLYNKQLLFPPRLPKGCDFPSNKIFAALYLLRPFMRPQASISATLRLKEALEHHPSVDRSKIGFPANYLK